MMTLRKIVLLVGLIGCCVALPQSSRTNGVGSECRRNSDCSPDHCCVLTPITYSTPSCVPLREEGESCRPGAPVTLNSTLSYPDGSQITLHDVHYVVCPCARNLKCGKHDGMCNEIVKSPPNLKNRV